MRRSPKRFLIPGKAGPQRAVVVGVRHGRMNRRDMERSFDELVRLVDTAGGVVVGRMSQEVRRADPATFLGSGKVAEIGKLSAEVKADFVVVDCELHRKHFGKYKGYMLNE